MRQKIQKRKLNLFIKLVTNTSILLKLDCCLFVCLSGLYYSDGGIETAFIIEIKTNFQLLLLVNKYADFEFRIYKFLI